MSRGRQRRSVRLREYDYTQTGAYFVTICTRERRLFFERDAIRAIAGRCWLEIPAHFPSVVLDQWVVMPNHFHGIIVLTNPSDDLNAPTPNSIDSNATLRIGNDLNVPTRNIIDTNATRRIDDSGDDLRRNDDEPNVPHRRGVQLNAPTPNVIDGNAIPRIGNDPNVPTENIIDDNVTRRIDDDDRGADDAIKAPHCRGGQLNAPTPNSIDSQRNIGDMHRRSMQRPRNPTDPYSVISPHRHSLAVIVRTYKAAVTTLCRRAGYTFFQWQRNYFERVIRDDSELNRTRQYIIDNPANWNQDEYYRHR